MKTWLLLHQSQAVLADSALGEDSNTLGLIWGGPQAWAEWMGGKIQENRRIPSLTLDRSFGRYLALKYLFALSAAALTAGATQRLSGSVLLTSFGFLLAFYAAEVQLLFLFPLLLTGCETPIRSSVQLTRAAGGTFHAIRGVLPIALWMVLGWLTVLANNLKNGQKLNLTRAMTQSWCVGCLSIVFWYLQLGDNHAVRKPHARLSF